MPRIGITGHSNLTERTAKLVDEALRAHLSVHEPANLVGVSCLARGADQVFARAVLEQGGAVEVVLPAADYRSAKVKPDNLAEFDELVTRATAVCTMPFQTSHREAYMAASKHLLASVDVMIAVWDGQPSGGHGGTADVVAEARKRGLRVTVVWPNGAKRD